MGEWEKGLEVARERGLIDENLRDRLWSLEFEREASVGKFPMRIALFVLGAILLVSAGFAVLVRVLGEDPSEFLVSAILIIVAIIAETIARLVQRAKVLTFLAGIIGTFAGLPLGFSLAILLPGEPNSGALALGFFVAALWSGYWFRRTKSGLAISAVVLELGGSIIAIGEMGKVSNDATRGGRLGFKRPRIAKTATATPSTHSATPVVSFETLPLSPIAIIDPPSSSTTALIASPLLVRLNQ
ncbi:MAG: hypothetical protein ACKPAJ_10760 [Actinomycetota bacterium]